MMGSPPVPARIVLAEDDAGVRLTTTDLLELSGHVVHGFASGRGALDHLEREGADLVITDMIMPGGDGPWLVAQVRARPALGALPVLVISARADEREVVSGLAAGADGYISKPFLPEELLETVAYWVARGRERQTRAAEGRTSP